MYEPLEVVKCKKCGKILAEPKELIKIVRQKMKGGMRN
jgi:ribosomal protein S27E